MPINLDATQLQSPGSTYTEFDPAQKQLAEAVVLSDNQYAAVLVGNITKARGGQVTPAEQTAQKALSHWMQQAQTALQSRDNAGFAAARQEYNGILEVLTSRYHELAGTSPPR